METLKKLSPRANREATHVRLSEMLLQTPCKKLDERVTLLLRHLPREDVRKALVELIKRASRDDFPTVKSVFLKHFGRDTLH
jgi:hypothetical protein